MEKEYKKILSIIAHKLKPDELETMKFLCKDFMPYIDSPQTEQNGSCLREVFKFFCQLEEHNKLGIDDLDLLKDMLNHLKREKLVLEVVKFQFQRKAYLSSLGASELARGDINQTTRNERRGIEEEEQQPREDQRNQSEEANREGQQEEEQQPREDQRNQSEEANREGQQGVHQSSRGTVVIRCVPYLAGAVWAIGSAYLLNHHINDPQALASVVSRVVIPIGAFIKKVFTGSINFLLQATDLNSLRELWKRYETGQLKDKLEQVMVTEELKNLANGEQIELVVTISEAEYRNACLDLMVAQSKAQTLCKRIISSSPTLPASRSLPDLTSLDATHDLSRVMHFEELLNSVRMKKKSIHASAGKSPLNLLRKETVLCLLQFINLIKSKIKLFPGFDLFVSPLSGATFGLGRRIEEEEYMYYHRSLNDNNPQYKLLLNLLQEVDTFLDGRNVLLLPEKAVKHLEFSVSRLEDLKLYDIDWIDIQHATERMRRFDYRSRGIHPFFSETDIKEKLILLTKEMKELAAFLVKEFNLDSRLLKDTQEEISSRKRKMPFSYDDDDALRRKLQLLRSDTEKFGVKKN